MTDQAPPTDDELLSGMAAFLAERHGSATLAMAERRIEDLAGPGDELALALWKGIAAELRRIGPSTVKH